MKAIVQITIFIILAKLNISAQDQDWEVHIGVNGRYDEAKSLIEFYDKGYYVEGGYDINSNWYGWEVKTNINGDVLWDKSLVHQDFEVSSRATTLDQDGNRYVCGRINNWPFVTKFDSCSEEIWCKILVDMDYYHGYSIDILMNEKNEIILMTKYDDDPEIEVLFLECLSEDGNYLWKKPYATKINHPWITEPNAYDLMEYNKEYYISGFCYWPFPDDTLHVFLRPLFIGIDSIFNEKWILPFYALDSVFGDAYKSIPLNDSVFMGVGLRRIESNSTNTLIMLYNINGEELGYSQIPNDSIGSNVFFNYISEVERVNDSLFLSLFYLAFSPGVALPFADVIFDKNAQIYNISSEPPNATGWAHFITSSDGNFVNAMGWENANGDRDIYLYKIDKDLQPVPFDTNTYTYDSLCPEPIQSGTIDLSDCLVWTGTEEIPSPEEYYSFIATIPITAFPNPAETEITLAFQNTDHHNNMLLECYNIYGQRVHSEKIWKGQQETRIDLQGWAKGLYFAVVKSDGKVAGTGRFVIK
jgi:hypothetical protein